jgi:hypothetical protein
LSRSKGESDSSFRKGWVKVAAHSLSLKLASCAMPRPSLGMTAKCERTDFHSVCVGSALQRRKHGAPNRRDAFPFLPPPRILRRAKHIKPLTINGFIQFEHAERILRSVKAGYKLGTCAIAYTAFKSRHATADDERVALC